jgi:hypothetical protein
VRDGNADELACEPTFSAYTRSSPATAQDRTTSSPSAVTPEPTGAAAALFCVTRDGAKPRRPRQQRALDRLTSRPCPRAGRPYRRRNCRTSFRSAACMTIVGSAPRRQYPKSPFPPGVTAQTNASKNERRLSASATPVNALPPLEVIAAKRAGVAAQTGEKEARILANNRGLSRPNGQTRSYNRRLVTFGEPATRQKCLQNAQITRTARGGTADDQRTHRGLHDAFNASAARLDAAAAGVRRSAPSSHHS